MTIHSSSTEADHARTGGRRRARKGEGELLRDEIIDAAEELLVEKGSKDAVTIRAVARAVGVSAPSIYLHFADKDELFYETCRRVFDGLNTRLLVAFADSEGGSVVDRMLRAGKAYIEFGLEHPGQYLVIFGTVPPDQMHPDELMTDPGVQSFELLVGAIEAGVDNGELRADLDVAATAVAVWGAVHGTTQLLITKRGIERINIPADDQVIEASLRIILEGLRA